jgi:DNA-binding MarR family transcriptional regulator
MAEAAVGRSALDRQLATVIKASRFLVALSVRTLGAVEPAVTPVQLRTLAILSDADAVTMGELADALGVHPSNATRLCDRLVGMQLVRRRENRDNRRMLCVELTESGHRLLAELMAARRAVLAQVLGALPETRRERLAEDLEALVHAARTAVPEGDLAALGWTSPDPG